MPRRILDKTTMILLIMILVFSGCSVIYISTVTNNALKDATGNDLIAVATIAADQIDGNAIAALKPGDEQTPAFVSLRDTLRRIKKSLPDIRYIYVMRQDGSAVEFAVDSEYGFSPDAAPVGKVYDSPTAEMIQGFQTPSVEEGYSTDPWGTFRSGYSPVRDSTGTIVGLVGVDIDQKRALERQDVVSTSAYLLMFLAILMAVFGVIGVERTRSRMIQDLTDREKRFRTLFESTYDAILIVRGGKFIDCNKGALRVFHGAKEEIVLKTPAELSPETQPDGRNSYEKSQEALDTVLKGTPRVLIWKHRTLDGQEFDAEVSMTRIELDGTVAVQAIVRDITERKRADDALKQSEQKYRILTESSPDAIYIVDAGHKVIYANMLASTLLSEGLREVIGFSKDGWPPGASTAGVGDIITQVLTSGQIGRREDRLVSRSGKEIWLDSTFMPLYDDAGKVYAVLGVSHDVTTRKTMETQIAASLKEKEFLLKEIHHRVKNNLQVISSLLSMQAKKATEPNVKESLTESQNRVKSIALVHEKLYQSRSLDQIEYGDYLNKIVMHLFEAFNVNQSLISCRIKAKDIYVDITQAVPCSLIINELLTNSLKYAFPDGRKGEIAIEFTSDANNYILSYHDNGIGIPEGVTFDRSQSLGMQLINGLTRQLDGTVTIGRGEGTTFTITFPHKQGAGADHGRK